MNNTEPTDLNGIMAANSSSVIHGNRNVGSITSTQNIPLYFYENIDMLGYSGIRANSYEWSLFTQILDGLQQIFLWENLPENMTSGNLERTLISAGRIKFIKVGKTYQYVRIAPTKWDKDNNCLESVIVEPFLPNLTGKKTEIFDSVEIKTNQIGESLITRIWPFLLGVAEQYRGLILNARALRGKGLVELQDVDTNQNFETSDTGEQILQTETPEDSFNSWMLGENPFKVVKSGMMGATLFTNFDFTDNTPAFLTTAGTFWNALLNSIGIPSNNVEGKQARLIVGEISIQNILQSKMLEAMLEYREFAAKQINETFGLNVSVKINIDKEPETTKGENYNDELQKDNS